MSTRVWIIIWFVPTLVLRLIIGAWSGIQEEMDDFKWDLIKAWKKR